MVGVYMKVLQKDIEAMETGQASPIRVSLKDRMKSIGDTPDAISVIDGCAQSAQVLWEVMTYASIDDILTLTLTLTKYYTTHALSVCILLFTLTLLISDIYLCPLSLAIGRWSCKRIGQNIVRISMATITGDLRHGSWKDRVTWWTDLYPTSLWIYSRPLIDWLIDWLIDQSIVVFGFLNWMYEKWWWGWDGGTPFNWLITSLSTIHYLQSELMLRSFRQRQMWLISYSTLHEFLYNWLAGETNDMIPSFF